MANGNSEEDEGEQFSPVSPDQNLDTDAWEIPQLGPQSKVLLCIDDNEDVLECEKEFLEGFGYTVLTARSGGKGLELASIHSVDVGWAHRQLAPNATVGRQRALPSRVLYKTNGVLPVGP